MSNFARWIMVLASISANRGFCEESNPYLRALQSRPWQSVQEYVTVRPGAHLFYWLYYADGTPERANQKPLLIWIQGGPGFAASGLANFAEIGPLNMNFEPRNHTWVNGRNLLLIDHPVGTGFSYADGPSAYAHSDKQAVEDLNRVIVWFFRKHEQFQNTSTYLFGQSYGAKLLIRLAYLLQKEQLKINFKGIGIGSGWVDPKESILVQPEFMYNMGLIDKSTYDQSLLIAKNVSNFMEKKDYVRARALHVQMFGMLIKGWSSTPNFMNLNQRSPHPGLRKLSRDVNSYVKPTLSIVNQTLTWDYTSDEPYIRLQNDLNIPARKCLETILNNTTLKVAVYNGNLDVLTPLAGASNWVHKLNWSGAEEFQTAKRRPIHGERNGFYKISRQLSFWSVFGSGHWVPEDNPVAMEHILEYMTKD